MNLHLYFYFIGWLYYSAVPLLVIWGNFFPEITSNLKFDPWFAWFTFLLMTTFCAGSFFGKFIRFSRKSIFMVSSNSPIFLIGSIVIFFPVLFGYLTNLRVGYGNEHGNSIGPMSTSLLFISFLFFYYRYKKNPKISCFLGFCLILNSSLLLLAGGRLYVVTIMFWYLAYLIHSRSINKKNLFITGALVTIFLVFLGQWRLGIAPDPMNSLFYLFAEPILVYHSADHYFSHHSMRLFDINPDILGSIVNLIPSILLPGKEVFYNSLSSQGVVSSVYGGLHITVSLAENFGFLGALLLSFLAGFALKRLSVISFNSPSALNFYFFTCSFSVFIYNREPFATQHKLLILMAVFLLAHNRWRKFNV